MLRLIGEEETQDVEYGGATFKVHVRAGSWWDTIRAAHIGKADNDAWQLAWLTGCLVGWTGLGDTEGEPIEFSKDVLLKVYKALPGDLRDELWATANGRRRKLKVELGNSTPSSANEG